MILDVDVFGAPVVSGIFGNLYAALIYPLGSQLRTCLEGLAQIEGAVGSKLPSLHRDNL